MPRRSCWPLSIRKFHFGRGPNKETSVHLNVLSEIGESPLPRINSRFGHPTPQNGVEIERNWKRPDYALPEMV